MELKEIASEFFLIRDNLFKAAEYLSCGNTSGASFKLGSLHNIAHENGEKIRKHLIDKENI